MPVFNNFQKTVSALLIEGLQPKIINNEKILLFYFHKFFDSRAIRFCYFELRKQTVSACIQNFKTKLTCLVANGRC